MPSWAEDRVSFFPEPVADVHPEAWDAVAAGLKGRRVLEIEYKSPRAREAICRRVEPLHAVSFRGEWYLVDKCRLRGELRTFAISRIRKAAVLKEEFDPPAGFDIREIMGKHFGIIYSPREYEVKIRFAPQSAQYARERQWHPSQKLTDHTDGGATLTMTVNHLAEVKRWRRWSGRK